MYTHILIPTDGSELAGKAVQHGVALAKRIGAKITILTVLPPELGPPIRPRRVRDRAAYRRDRAARMRGRTKTRAGHGVLVRRDLFRRENSVARVCARVVPRCAACRPPEASAPSGSVDRLSLSDYGRCFVSSSLHDCLRQQLRSQCPPGD